jgi:hypothetical protein
MYKSSPAYLKVEIFTVSFFNLPRVSSGAKIGTGMLSVILNIFHGALADLSFCDCMPHKIG